MNKLIAIGVVCIVANLSINPSAYGIEKRLVIGFNKAPGESEISLIESNHGTVDKVYSHVRALSVKIEESQLSELLNSPDVAYIEEDISIQTVNPVTAVPGLGAMAASSVEYENAWSVALINTETAHNKSITGSGVKIAILDTGIDYNHPDLALNYAGGENFISLDPENHDPFDDSWNSHGTHVAGTIAAQLDGVGVVGVAPDASIYAVKVLDGAGFGSVSDIVAGIDWAISNQMDIVNMSVGMDQYSQSLEDACALAEAAGIMLIAAAGNSYGGPVLYPAALPSVVAVGATTIFGDISVVSPIGPEMEVVAPGLNVFSTVGMAWGGYGFLGGTSQAAPHVSGLAALLMSSGDVVDIDGNGVVDNRDLRMQIQYSTIDLGDVGFDEIHGYGLIDVATAFSGIYPVSHLLLEVSGGPPRNSAKTFNIKDGVFDVTIVNTSLRALKMLVFEGGHLRRDLTEKLRFARAKHDDDEDLDKNGNANIYPQETSVSLDATGTALKLVFLPKGKKHSQADIYIQKQ